MRLRFVFIIVLLFVWTASFSQSRKSRGNAQAPVDTVPELVRQYQDSLLVYKAMLDSMERANSQLEARMDSRLYKLFVPLTFYKGISHNQFSLQSKGSSLVERELDNALLNTYLNRPDLVTMTETQLESVNQIEAPVARENTQLETIISQKEVQKVAEPELAPVNIVVKKPNFWKFSADTYFQLLQNYVSTNWYKGGESNYSMMSSLTLQANYNNKQKVKWDNKLELKLGMQTSRDDTVHSVKTSEDMIRYTSKLGIQASRRWYYTFQSIATTQFMKHYNSNSHTITADFFAPVTLSMSLGMDYNIEWFKKRLTGTVHMGPLAYNMKYVNREYLAARNGIDEGRKVKNDYGSLVTIDLEWKILNNLKWKTHIYGYTTYERTEFTSENTFTFQFNKYISTNIFVYPRFDDSTKRDDHHGYWQYKEYMSMGFSYSF